MQQELLTDAGDDRRQTTDVRVVQTEADAEAETNPSDDELETRCSKTNENLKTPRDKLGLALSGGGLRASFFHIGVLARLAEVDLLRHVEVLSTISGGSIIGALYYLYAKRLLEKPREG